MEEIAPGVYVQVGYAGGNVGFIVTGAGVICVDAPMFPDQARHWQEQIAAVSDEPLIALVQTDYYQGRVIGTRWFDVPVVAHDIAWDKMRGYGSERMNGQINEILRKHGYDVRWQVRMPEITFSDQLFFYKGSREVQVLHGGGHSPATCMVYLPAEKLIFTGDVIFYDMHPTMQYADTRQWLSTLQMLSEMPLETIVPGHGEICGPEAIAPMLSYISDMRDMVRQSFQRGCSKSETSSAVVAEFLDAFPYADGERDRVRRRVKGGSDRIYDEFRAEARAAGEGVCCSRKGKGKKRKR